jgi:predicted nuclease of restriction endonuclease-like (RecB) superfamily
MSNQSNEITLFNDVSDLIKKSRVEVAISTNCALSFLFWQVGKRILEHILQYQRAAYGKEIMTNLSEKLVQLYGRNFAEKNLRRMVQFAEQFSDEKIVVPLARQLSWSHLIILLPLKSMEAKLYYANACAEQLWGKRELREQINRKAFERSEIANNQLVNQQSIPFNTFKDPYILDFLELKNEYLERDLEQAILRELERFILEVGKGFTFVERQKRMIIDGEDFFLDLLFFHRKLKRMVAIELKFGKFRAADKGQMELYLKWLDRNEKYEGEEKPVGLILCTEGSREQVELLEMSKDGIMVAEYWTDLPPRKVLEEKLHQALVESRELLDRKKLF